MPEGKYPSTPEEAIFEIYSRVVSLETTIRGTPNTQEGGLVQAVQEVKALAVEVKDANIDQGKLVVWLQARCRAFHGESNQPLTAGPGAAVANENPLAKVPKGRVLAFLASAALFVALVIYNLGGLLGWWTVK